MDRPILSICIPTFNRSKDLKNLLNDIATQIDCNSFSNLVEVVISDNASNDSTLEVVDSFRDRIKLLQYSRNHKDIGPDQNGIKTFEMANGIFCWPLSDKRRLYPYAVAQVVEAIKRNADIRCIIIDTSISNHSERRFKSGSCLLGTHFGSDMSTCIFRKEYFPSDYKRFSGSAWLHYGVLLEMSIEHEILIINNVIDMDKVDKTCRWAENGGVFYARIGLTNLIKGLPDIGYDRNKINEVVNCMAMEFPAIIASAKLHGLRVSMGNIKMIYATYGFNVLYSNLSLLVLLSPVQILSIVKIIKDFVKIKSFSNS